MRGEVGKAFPIPICPVALNRGVKAKITHVKGSKLAGFDASRTNKLRIWRATIVVAFSFFYLLYDSREL